jgi:hypothetical protein
MPSIAKSQRVTLDNYKPAPAPAQPAQIRPAPPPDDDPNGRSPYMLVSMPLMASTGDAFARQFYGGSNIPTIRTMPLKKGAGA